MSMIGVRRSHALLDEIRKELNLSSDAELADLLGLHRQQVCFIRSRDRKVNNDFIIRTHDACGWSIEHIRELAKKSTEENMEFMEFETAPYHALLDKLRKKFNLKSDVKLAEFLGFSQSHISKIRARQYEINGDFTLRVHDVCGWPVKRIRELVKQSSEES
jgi:plasmid maintenance system antidote protein VapI